MYRFFDSKKAINEAVAERLIAEVEAQLEAIARGTAPAAERLRAFIDTCHHLCVARFTGNQRMHEMVEVAMTVVVSLLVWRTRINPLWLLSAAAIIGMADLFVW